VELGWACVLCEWKRVCMCACARARVCAYVRARACMRVCVNGECARVRCVCLWLRVCLWIWGWEGAWVRVRPVYVSVFFHVRLQRHIKGTVVLQQLTNPTSHDNSWLLTSEWSREHRKETTRPNLFATRTRRFGNKKYLFRS